MLAAFLPPDFSQRMVPTEIPQPVEIHNDPVRDGSIFITAMRPLAPLEPLSATINVSIFIDEYNDTSTGCSLREAVQSANNNADFGGCKHSGTYGHDTIYLMESGTYEVNRGTEPAIAEDANIYGDLDIIPNPSMDINPYDVTISGQDASTTFLDGDYKDRLFDVQADAAIAG